MKPAITSLLLWSLIAISHATPSVLGKWVGSPRADRTAFKGKGKARNADARIVLTLNTDHTFSWASRVAKPYSGETAFKGVWTIAGSKLSFSIRRPIVLKTPKILLLSADGRTLTLDDKGSTKGTKIVFTKS